MVELRAKDRFIELAIQLAQYFVKEGNCSPIKDSPPMTNSAAVLLLTATTNPSLKSRSSWPMYPKSQRNSQLKKLKGRSTDNVSKSTVEVTRKKTATMTTNKRIDVSVRTVDLVDDLNNWTW